jgi:hypothetical protein
MSKDEALRLALEALEKISRTQYHIETPPIESLEERMRRIADQAITASKAALEAKVEPDKYAIDIECTKCGAKQSGVLTVHTTPPQRKPLSDEELTEIFSTTKGLDFYLNFARAIEAAHGIKENT